MIARRTSLAVLLVIASTWPAFGQAPPKTRQDILRYAETGIGSPYVWGGGNWDPNDRSFGGADCSGFVSKCWSLSRWTPFRVNLHGPATAHYIQTPGSDWYEVDRADMIYGDAIVYRYNNNQNGHTYIYMSGDGWGEHEVYEARGTDYGIVRRWRTAYSEAETTKGIRCANLIENVGETEHIVESDDGAPAYTDTGMTGSSAYDSSARGCTEGDCRYRWVTAAPAESCTFRPILPETGWYRVYVTCNEGSPNVHDVGVTVNDAFGTARYLWNQADANGLNAWTPIGDSFYFEAGSVGSVVWDDYDAWPTTGDYVFRGDATKFVLDNRVVVDGIGGAPGCFDSVSAAAAWLRSRPSEVPDVIDITCDTVFEPACIELDMWDDLTINGDADDNGVSATLIVTPSTPADGTTPCGMYLNMPIQHAWTLRDVILIPSYVSAGHAVGAHGLVIDVLNPSGQASGGHVTLNNVTIAGSLPGSIPTDAGSDSRALATMFGGVGGSTDAALLQRTATWAGDDACRQSVTATGLTVTHSATDGIVVTSAYTAWHVTGGLRLTYNGGNGLKGYYLNGSTMRIDASSGASNQIAHNAGRGIINLGSGGTGSVDAASCAIVGNAGGVHSAYAHTVLQSCVLANNETSGSGGALWQAGGTATLSHCTMASNVAGAGGDAVYSSGGATTVYSSIVWDHGVTPLVGTVSATYCDIEGGFAGTSNIDQDPVFVDAGAGDYHLRRLSPCINAADSQYSPAPGEVDIDGEPRVMAMFGEIGADEVDYWDGDADQDGDVDGDDVVALGACLSGPELAPSQGATCLGVFDADEDGDIDLRDAAAFGPRAAAGTEVADIVMETRDAGGAQLSPPAYVEDGGWANSTAKSTLPELAGAGSRYISYDLPNSGTDNATFVPAFVAGGVYEVFVTWGTGANCSDARYTIEHADGTTVLLVDQVPEGVAGANANTWVSLGQYRFAAGQSAAVGSVNVSEVTVSGKPHSGWNQRVYADAAKFEFVGP